MVRRIACLSVFLLAAPSLGEGLPRCNFGAGALPSQTAPRQPHGSQLPIDNIVVLMQENRSFDHYFGQIHFEGQPRARRVPRNASNPDPTNPGGPPIRRFHQDHYCEVADLDHSWNGTHHEWDGGAMDGFTAANVDSNDPTGSRTMGYYDKTDLPFYYALYSTFAMADRYFCSTLTQTFPNRFYLLAGTSFGHIRNDFPNFAAGEYSQRTIFNSLDEAGVSWKVYYDQVPFAGLFGYVRSHAANTVPFAQFMTDAQAGTLPQVSFVDPIFIAQANVENDEHPPSNIQVGQSFVSSAVGAFVDSPQWSHGALLLTYDEHGGYFDHVRPPPACTPDDVEPMLESGDVPGHFDRYGIRVPFVVVSPYSRKHYVSHRVYDHGSILRFIETRFDLPALTRRDANADPLLRLFKFSRPSFPVAPTLPAATIDDAQFAACASAPPPSP
ncbi:MAG: alkaline phosphatase family protein [Deltaproteobacteria bacterium]|nr:MAG: alkaline phosphatase family protein [Deltaproteobacteria bacterium]